MNRENGPYDEKGMTLKNSGEKQAVLRKRQKRALVTAGGLLLLLSAVSLVLGLLPGKERVEATLYSYQVTADASHRVHIVPNELYGSEWLEEGKAYPEVLTDYIEFRFKAPLQGSGPATVSGSYQIKAVMEGYQNAAEGRRIIYEKQFSLKEGVISGTDDGQAVAEANVQVYLAPYRQFAAQADQILHTSVARDISLYFTGIFTIDTEFGQKKQEFTYQVSFPIGTGASIYEIKKPAPFVAEGGISETEEIDKPINMRNVLLSSLAWVVGLALLLSSRFFGRLPDEEKAWQTEMKRILRKYGSRMVRLEHLPDFGQKECIFVADIESMISMAEEMRQPLLYCPDMEQLPQDGVFFTFDAEQVCLFQVKRPLTTLVVDSGAGGGT